MVMEVIPNDVAVAALETAAKELRGLCNFTIATGEILARRELVADTLLDLASNITGGVVQLRRMPSGGVLIVGGIDESDLVS